MPADVLVKRPELWSRCNISRVVIYMYGQNRAMSSFIWDSGTVCFIIETQGVQVITLI
jgi:hypothetical protein